MKEKDEKILEQFKNENNRLNEESFSMLFSMHPEVRFLFEDENTSYTDGKQISVDPGFNELYRNENAWKQTLKFMKNKNLPVNIDYKQRLVALFWITRALNIHESSHVLYTNFPGAYLLAKDKPEIYIKIVSRVSNIIEDAFIDATTIERYTEAYAYIYLLRVLTRMGDVFPIDKEDNTEEESNDKEDQIDPKYKLLNDILNYYIIKCDYPMVDRQKITDQMQTHIKELDPMFDDGCTNGDPDKRDQISVEIADYLIENVLETSLEELENIEKEQQEMLEKLLDALSKMQMDSECEGGPANGEIRKGRKRGSISLGISSETLKERLKDAIREVSENAEEARAERDTDIGDISVKFYDNDMLDAGSSHDGITVRVYNMPKNNTDLKKKYDRVVEKYRPNIINFNRRFERILFDEVQVDDGRKIIGSKLSSKNFADGERKRYWVTPYDERVIPDLAIAILVDASGSMDERFETAEDAVVVIHESLKKYELQHSVVLYNASYNEPFVNHYLLYPFNARRNEEYNLVYRPELINTREGLTLKWVKNYLKPIYAEYKTVIVISDGAPYHHYGAGYSGKPANMDCIEKIEELKREHISVVAIALEGCYDDLSKIYGPENTVDCKDIKDLSEQLFKIINIEIKKNK